MTEPLTAIVLLLEDVAPELAAVRAERDPATAARWPFHLEEFEPDHWRQLRALPLEGR